MSFFEFQNTFVKHPVISILEIKKYFSNFDNNALTRWQKKGYIRKIRNGFYRLSKPKITTVEELFFTANRIYWPSYISLHSALRWYDFIPEEVFSITSVTTKKTQQFETVDGTFKYQNFKKNLFFGYKLEKNNKGYYFKMATPEKALLDFLYLNPHLKTEDDIFELRLNAFEIQEKVNLKVLDAYLSLFDSKALNKRVSNFKKILYNENY